MPKPENESTPQNLKINRTFIGVMLSGVKKEQIPNVTLVQAVMNASAIVLFDLRPSFSTEGGVEGIYKKNVIELSNSQDELGMIDENFAFIKAGKGMNEVLNFYEKFLRLTYMGKDPLPVDSSDQVVADTLNKLNSVIKTIGGKTLPIKVMSILTSNELSRRYLRGLTDEEITGHFVPPSD